MPMVKEKFEEMMGKEDQQEKEEEWFVNKGK